MDIFDPDIGLQYGQWDLQGGQSIGYWALQTTFGKKKFFDSKSPSVRSTEREPRMDNVHPPWLTLSPGG